MKIIAILAAVFTVCNASLLQPIVHRYVSAPTVLTHQRVAIPASIPTTVPEIITRAQTVPEHRFSRSDWVQPTSQIIPAVRQYTVRTDIPVAVRSVSLEPAVQYSTHLAPITLSAPAVALPHIEPIVQQTIWKR